MCSHGWTPQVVIQQEEGRWEAPGGAEGRLSSAVGCCTISAFVSAAEQDLLDVCGRRRG